MTVTLGACVCVCPRAQRYDSVSVSRAIWIHETHLMQSSRPEKKKLADLCEPFVNCKLKTKLAFFSNSLKSTFVSGRKQVWPVDTFTHKQQNWVETVQVTVESSRVPALHGFSIIVMCDPNILIEGFRGMLSNIWGLKPPIEALCHWYLHDIALLHKPRCLANYPALYWWFTISIHHGPDLSALIT